MTIITRYSKPLTGPSVASKPLLLWDTGLTPGQRWVGGRLPNSGDFSSWASEVNSGVLIPGTGGTVNPTVGSESGVKYAHFSGVNGCQMSISLPDTELRTVTIIARPNTGDAYFTSVSSSPIGGSNANAIVQGVNNDVATMTATGTATLPAPRDRWHVYSYSVTAPGGTGVLVVDENDTTFAANAAAQTTLRIGRSSTANYRQLRIVEIITSPQTATAAQMKAMYAKAKAWYPGLTW